MFIELITKLYEQTMLENVVSKLKAEFYPTMAEYYRLHTVLQTRNVKNAQRKIISEDLIKGVIKSMGRILGTAQSEKLALQYKNCFTKHGTTYGLICKSVLYDLSHGKYRYPLLKFMITQDGTLKITLQLYRCATEGGKLQATFVGEIEHWEYKRFVQSPDSEKRAVVSQLGSYLTANAANIELYSEQFEKSKYVNGVIHFTNVTLTF